jgi:hypothetical protein
MRSILSKREHPSCKENTMDKDKYSHLACQYGGQTFAVVNIYRTITSFLPEDAVSIVFPAHSAICNFIFLLTAASLHYINSCWFLLYKTQCESKIQSCTNSSLTFCKFSAQKSVHTIFLVTLHLPTFLAIKKHRALNGKAPK